MLADLVAEWSGRFLRGEASSFDVRAELFKWLDVNDVNPEERMLLGEYLISLGLTQYAEPSQVSGLSSFTLAAHGVELGDRRVILSPEQQDVIARLLGGENVVLSAPTSFGKSLLLDVYIRLAKPRHVVVVVPTLALIDEVRTRLVGRFGAEYVVVSHTASVPEVWDRRIDVLTPERVIEMSDFDGVDFYLIDEFYKLDLGFKDERAGALNRAFARLLKTRARFMLAGPFIDSVPTATLERLDAVFVRHDAPSVHTELIRTDESAEDVVDGLLAGGDSLPCLVYCNAPQRVEAFAAGLASRIGNDGAAVEPEIVEAADWIAAEFGDDWALVAALRRGVGFYHGAMPRAIGQIVVSAFNRGLLPILVSNSSMIEGVNTSARTVVIADRRVGRSNVTHFAFRNICGRAGRSFQYFVGKVWICGFDPPADGDVGVDIPIASTEVEKPLSLIMGLDEEDLSRLELDSRQMFLDSSPVPESVWNAAMDFDPDRVDRVYRDFLGIRGSDLANLYMWSTAYPRYEELEHTLTLMWRLYGSPGRNGVTSPRQLTFLLDAVRRNRTYARFAQGRTTDSRNRQGWFVTVRTWMSYRLPRGLSLLDAMRQEVLGEGSGNYVPFAAFAEAGFSSRNLLALEERGVPMEMSMKFEDVLPDSSDPNLLARSLRANAGRAGLSPFEQRVIGRVV